MPRVLWDSIRLLLLARLRYAGLSLPSNLFALKLPNRFLRRPFSVVKPRATFSRRAVFFFCSPFAIMLASKGKIYYHRPQLPPRHDDARPFLSPSHVLRSLYGGLPRQPRTLSMQSNPPLERSGLVGFFFRPPSPPWIQDLFRGQTERNGHALVRRCQAEHGHLERCFPAPLGACWRHLTVAEMALLDARLLLLRHSERDGKAPWLVAFHLSALPFTEPTSPFGGPPPCYAP